MSRSPSEAYLRQRSPWRVLAPVLALAVVFLAAVAVRAASGPPPRGTVGPGEIVFGGGIGLIAIWAVWDGLRRVLGRPTFLGTGIGMDRLFGVIQVLMSIGLAIGLLPNTIRLLEFLVSGGRTP